MEFAPRGQDRPKRVASWDSVRVVNENLRTLGSWLYSAEWDTAYTASSIPQSRVISAVPLTGGGSSGGLELRRLPHQHHGLPAGREPGQPHLRRRQER